METENWKAIAGFEGLYDISDLGHIRSYRKVMGSRITICVTPQCLLKIQRDKDGYASIVLNGKERKVPKKVHRLVLEAFVGPCPAGQEACHIDGVKQNNHLSNLRWDTHRRNQMVDGRMQGTCKMGLPGEKNHAATLSETAVRKIRQLAEDGKSHLEIAKLTGVRRRHVSRIIDRTRWAHVV
jgi:hypothetical protein